MKDDYSPEDVVKACLLISKELLLGGSRLASWYYVITLLYCSGSHSEGM